MTAIQLGQTNIPKLGHLLEKSKSNHPVKFSSDVYRKHKSSDSDFRENFSYFWSTSGAIFVRCVSSKNQFGRPKTYIFGSSEQPSWPYVLAVKRTFVRTVNDKNGNSCKNFDGIV